MTRAPQWDINEFKTLLNHPYLENDEFKKMLPQRTIGSITVVRSGLHSYHKGGNISMLSKMMIHVLKDKKKEVICPICNEKF